ncbi:MAG: glycosyltransferase [bacterium]|nr:glycosyltransferase [bacterium]
MLTIVIPTKDEEKNLPKLLESIAKQTLQPKQVIVADAQSEDQTRDIARTFGATIVEGGMVGEGRNAGARAVKTDTILFLDSDVVLTDETFLEKAFGEFQERALGIATCDLVPMSERRIDSLMHNAYNKYVRALGSMLPHAGGAIIMASKAAHDEIGGFDETITFCEDHVYARSMAKVAPFGILKSVKLPVSVRRLDKDGRLKIMTKFALAEAHLLTLGPIRDDRFNYTFDHNKKEE